MLQHRGSRRPCQTAEAWDLEALSSIVPGSEEAQGDGQQEQIKGKVATPLTAEAFGVEEIIDPRSTRRMLIDWARRACEIELSHLGPRTRGMRP